LKYFRNMGIMRWFRIMLLVLPCMAVMMLFFGYTSKRGNSTVFLEDQSAVVWARGQLLNMSLEEKIGQFFMVPAYSNQGEAHLKEVESFVTEEKVGGIIFFQGEREDLKTAISRFQKAAKLPLFVGMDAEWGVQMRLFGEDRFPYAYTLGAADDVGLSEKIAAMMAQECRKLGIHLNFSPVADVNSNADNPVIGFRSYGENPKKVAEQVRAAVKGMEGNGILTSIKHFPGHGDTDKDSHFELPTVSRSSKSIDAVEFYPFREGVKAGASSVMIGHLNVPALDKSGLPSSLSKRIIQGYLQDSMGFKGLVISDALNMKAVSAIYGKTEVVVKAFEAGCDILLFPESVRGGIAAIVEKVKSGNISMEEVDRRCLKVLKAKFKFVIQPKTVRSFTAGEVDWAKKEVYEKAFTVLKNEKGLLPLKKVDNRIARISIGTHTTAFREGMDRFAKVDHYHFYTAEEAKERMGAHLKSYDVIITAFHAATVRPKNEFGMPKGWKDWLSNLPSDKNNVLVIFGNPLALKTHCDLTKVKSVVLGFENHPLAQERMSQFIFGAIGAAGKLPFTISNSFERGSGMVVEGGGRLKYSQAEELGIDPEKLGEIDLIVKKSIAVGAFPGCQIAVAVEGKLIYQKSFGTLRYEDTVAVQNSDLYDIASITKIAGSTLGLMKLQSEGKFSLERQLKDYIPEVTGIGSFGGIELKDMMTHQAGLTAWIPFYIKTMNEGELSASLYSRAKKDGYQIEVAKDLWIKDSYIDTIYKRILSSHLGQKKYEYSDLGYYFVKKIIEKQAAQPLEEFLMANCYAPMGLQHICYRPLKYFPLSQIAPTENDKVFRKQQIHGYVHDPGAAMLGGVGGHAGIFSNAVDLAAVMQLFLNKGVYGSFSYLNKAVVEQYTRCQFPATNRRGIGFDRPKITGGGTCDEAASQSSFGHSGFTGTLAWADPLHQINYVFLSNRVYQNQENWKIRELNIRTNIQKVIYDAVFSSQKKWNE
jgi:beta-N-acetylhexosaminidase